MISLRPPFAFVVLQFTFISVSLRFSAGEISFATGLIVFYWVRLLNILCFLGGISRGSSPSPIFREAFLCKNPFKINSKNRSDLNQ